MTQRPFLLSLAAAVGLLFAAASAPGKTAPEPATPPPAAPAPAPATAETSIEAPKSVVRVNVTNQPYDFFRPWNKRAPYQRRAIGPVLPGGRILATGELVANATYLELEKADSGEKIPATVEVVDYESNLALLKPVSETFLDGFEPLKVGEARIGDTLTVWQLENTGTLLRTQALFTTADLYQYPIDGSALIVYRLTTALQPREGTFTAPVVHDGVLVGMLMRYNSRTQNADVIPGPVIAHFLKDATSGEPYRGFPRAGLAFAPLRDPQLRRYAKAPEGNGGVYITDVVKDGPGAEAEIRKGDVLLSVGGHSIDRDGNYVDPRYGKVSIIHYLSTQCRDGDRVPFKLRRDGKEITREVTLRHRDPSSQIIEPYTIDQAPRYSIIGGVVLQELSRQYLKEWGGDWVKKAPERFVYFDQFQNDLFRDDPRERIVILSQILPSPCTIGYEDLRGLEVTKINGLPLKSLRDVEKALAQPENGFHRIELSDHPGEIIIDAKEAAAIEPALMKNYGLPALHRLE